MTQQVIITLNAGSSSIKFSLYTNEAEPHEFVSGDISGLGGSPVLSWRGASGRKHKNPVEAPDYEHAIRAIFERLVRAIGSMEVVGVGHRIVHGGIDYVDPVILDDVTMAKLHELEPLAPLHQPANLRTVYAAREAFPDATQLACFDTAFHRSHPFVNDTFALPEQFYEAGVRRYGFHGLSYDYVTGEMVRRHGDLGLGRLVIAHLGNGASMCAIKDGKSVGSTMGFSALDGLPMGTRCGQIDPGVVLYLMQHEKMNGDEIANLLYRESGLKGMSGTTNDMQVLQSSDDPRAKKALDYYVFRIRRELGAMAAILGGIDALVFCGGIGENSRIIRQRVCEGMEWIGISLDERANEENAERISDGRVSVHVINTDEERVIARALVAKLSENVTDAVA